MMKSNLFPDVYLRKRKKSGRNYIFEQFVIVYGKRYEIELDFDGNFTKHAALVVEYMDFDIIRGPWIVLNQIFERDPIKYGMIAHECGHIALDHWNVNYEFVCKKELARCQGLPSAILSELAADTWAVENLPYGKELFHSMEETVKNYPNTEEYRIRLCNLETLLGIRKWKFIENLSRT